MVKTVNRSVELGLHVEVLSNCYWATCIEDALEWLLPMAEAKDVELSLSSDPYHGERWITEEAKNAVNAAKALSMKVGIMAIKCPCSGSLPYRSGRSEGWLIRAYVPWQGMLKTGR
jgi:hypothetical protein